MAGLSAAVSSMLAAFALGTALNLVAAMLPRASDDGGVWSRAAATALSAAVLAVPFALHGPPLFRALVAQGLVVETWRVLEIVRTPSRFTRRERALRIVLLPYQFTFLERVPRRWPVRDLALSSVVLGCGAAVLVLSSRLSPAVTPYSVGGWPRWLGATVGGYVVMEGTT